jgi:pyruvate dehydrogenase kinase 2/3/4
VIPNLSLGLTLASPHLPPDQLDAFMRRMLVSRISRRVLAEHHIALSDTVAGRNRVTSGEDGHVGIIYTGLNVAKSVRRCTALLHELTHGSDRPFPSGHDSRWPSVIIEGHIDTQFAYIKEHLESASLLLFGISLTFVQVHRLRVAEERAFSVLACTGTSSQVYTGHASHGNKARQEVRSSCYFGHTCCSA